MTSVSRYLLTFLFIAVSVFGFAGKVVALTITGVNPKAIVLPTGGYTVDEDVTVWFFCDNLWWHAGYYLDKIPPSNVLSNPADNGTIFANRTMLSIITGGTQLTGNDSSNRCGGVKEVPLGRLAVGWHSIHFFLWNWEGWGSFQLSVFSYFSGYFEVCVANMLDSCTAESLPNTCGTTASRDGTIRCNGSCSAYAPSTPSNPSYYQNSCQLTSARNACGQTKTANVGTFDCDGTCVGTRPAVPPVTVPPAAPSVSGPSRAPAWNEAGYPVNATGAACNNTSVTQYFEFSRDGVNWTGDNPGFPPSSWATLP